MTNNFFNNLSPQMQQQVQYHIQQAKQSGNPEQYVKQTFGNNPMFMQGFNLFNQQGMQGLQNFIASNLK